MKNPFPSLYLTRLIFTLRVDEELWLPRYKGFTFRGGLGDALLALVCDCSVKNRAPHAHGEACRYQEMFKTQIHDQDMRAALALGQNAPAPIMVNPPETQRRHFHEGEVLTCEVLLIGRAGAYWMHIIEAIRLLGDKLGIGADAAKFTVMHVYDGTGGIVYSVELGLSPRGPAILTSDALIKHAPARRLQLQFVTPTYLRLRGAARKDATVQPSRFRHGDDLLHIYWPLVQRLHTLTHCYCSETPLDRYFENRYRHDLRGIALKDNTLEWRKVGRHFSRVQKQGRRIEGFEGELSFEGDLKPFIPYFQLGQYLNIGKHTISGQGRFEVLS